MSPQLLLFWLGVELGRGGRDVASDCGCVSPSAPIAGSAALPAPTQLPPAGCSRLAALL